ncbi:MAG: PAS domain-containing protein [Thermoanaerobaculia bacterium]
MPKCTDTCDQVRHLLADAVDRIAVGIAVVSPAGKILELNRAAREIVTSDDVLDIDGGVLVASNPLNAAVLADTLAKVTAGNVRSGSFAALARNGRRAPLHVFAAPLRLDGERRASAVALYLSIPERTLRANEQLLKILFGLSGAEARVAAGIVEGLAVPDLAEKLHVSVHTVRTQLKSIFAKTGAQRQSDLVRLITSGLALVATER